jgi:hypothetical protein
LIDEARLIRLTAGNSPADAQVEVAHEALVRNWPRMVNWLDEEQETMRRRLRLTAAVEQWDATGRDPEALLQGTLLQEALRYEGLSELESMFVRASEEAVAAAQRRERGAQQRELERAQAQAARRARLLLLTLGVVFLLALIAAGLMVQRTRQNAELAVVAAAADAVETRIAAESALVTARNAEATALAKLATSEAVEDPSDDQVAAAAELTTAQALAEEASVVQATTQAAQLTAVARRQAAQAMAKSMPMLPPRRPKSLPIPQRCRWWQRSAEGRAFRRTDV